MWQSLVRNWLLNQAKERLYEAAQQPAQSRPQGSNSPAPDDETSPPREPQICHVGVVFALGIEAGGLADRLQGLVATQGAGFTAREGAAEGKRVVLIESGAGQASAEQATAALIAGHAPRWIISAGFAGGLRDEVKPGHIVLADEIVDTQGQRLQIDLRMPSGPGLHVGRLLTADRIVASAAEKRSLGLQHSALAVDMESLAVAQVCRDNRVRFLAIRVISDAVDHELPADLDHLMNRKTLAGKIGAATGAIVRRPSSVKDLWQLKEDALVASERLAKFLLGVIAQLD